MLTRRREEDACAVEPDLRVKEIKRIERLKGDATQIRDWLSNTLMIAKGVKA